MLSFRQKCLKCNTRFWANLHQKNTPSRTPRATMLSFIFPTITVKNAKNRIEATTLIPGEGLVLLCRYPDLGGVCGGGQDFCHAVGSDATCKQPSILFDDFSPDYPPDSQPWRSLGHIKGNQFAPSSPPQRVGIGVDFSERFENENESLGTRERQVQPPRGAIPAHYVRRAHAFFQDTIFVFALA